MTIVHPAAPRPHDGAALSGRTLFDMIVPKSPSRIVAVQHGDRVPAIAECGPAVTTRNAAPRSAI
jgi:hypothetical protein